MTCSPANTPVSRKIVQADDSIGNATVVDNVEAYAAGSPILAISGDDFLTGSSGHDLFVFSQPIGHDTVYSFDVAADQIDLIDYTGFASFSDVQAHTADDGAANAVITLGDGQSITLHGVDAASLTDNDFVFDQTPVTENAGSMTISDGAILPLSGTINNTGTIALNSTGDETDLQLIEHGITLEGHGQVTLSDSAENVITGTVSDVTLTNVDNTISGAGRLGGGLMGSSTKARSSQPAPTHSISIPAPTSSAIPERWKRPEAAGSSSTAMSLTPGCSGPTAEISLSMAM